MVAAVAKFISWIFINKVYNKKADSKESINVVQNNLRTHTRDTTYIFELIFIIFNSKTIFIT